MTVLLHHLLLLLIEDKQPVINVQLVVTEEAVTLGTLSLPVLHEPELANICEYNLRQAAKHH